MACPDEETLAALVSLQLPPKARQEVEDHAATCEHCAQTLAIFVELYVPGESTGVRTVDHLVRRQATPLARGTTIGRFLVVQEVGRGGMGVVYAAYDPELDRKVAIKLLAPGLPIGARELEARFRREAQTMARLVHPNVVTVLDFGLDESVAPPRLFVAMEYVEGSTLRTWLHARPRSVDEILDAFLAAARGLAAAHAAGIVHRDFKPDNVLIDREGHVRVTDFGLARAFGPETNDPTESGITSRSEISSGELTADDTVVGTPVYMAPEQIDGVHVGPAADQFAWCVALYEALYGCRPFPHRSLEERSTAIARGQLASPSVRRSVPTRLQRAIVMGLRAAPSDRHSSMQSMVRAIERGRRRRLGRAVLLVAAAGALAVATQMLQRTALHCPDPDAELVEVWTPEISERLHRHYRAQFPDDPEAGANMRAALDARADAWRDAMRSVCDDQASGKHTTAVIALRSDCLRQRHEELRVFVDGVLRADSDVLAATALDELPTVDRCGDVSQALAHSEALIDPSLRPAIDEARRRLASARALRASGRPTPAHAVIEEVVASVRELGHPPVLAEALLEQGLNASDLGREREAREALQETLSIAVSMPRSRIPVDALIALLWLRIADGSPEELTLIADLALGHIGATGSESDRRSVLLRRGYAERLAGRYARAQQDWAAAAALSSTRGEELLDRANDAMLAADAGEWSVAEPIMQAWLELAESVPDGFGLTGSLSYDLGIARCAMGDLDGARARHERALEVHRTVYGPEHPQIAAVHRALSECMFEHGQVEGALHHLERARELHERVEISARDRLQFQSLLVVAAVHRGELERANEVHAVLVERVRDRWGAGTPLGADFELAFGEALLSCGHPERAVAHLGRAYEIYATALGPARSLTAKAQALHGIALGESGDTRAALAELDEALQWLRPEVGFPHVAARAFRTRAAYREADDPDGAASDRDRAAALVMKTP